VVGREQGREEGREGGRAGRGGQVLWVKLFDFVDMDPIPRKEKAR